MYTLSRRLFLASGAALATIIGRPVAAQGATSGIFVRQALERRRSTRLYGPDPIAEATLLDLLFAANGVNRPDGEGRTAPLGMAPGTSTSTWHRPVEWKGLTEPFVGTAPAVLLYVSDQGKLNDAAASFEIGQPPELVERQHEIAAYVDTAVVAEDVYIYCAAEGLGTCLVGGSDPAAIGLALPLRPEQRVTYVQPVG